MSEDNCSREALLNDVEDPDVTLKSLRSRNLYESLFQQLIHQRDQIVL